MHPLFKSTRLRRTDDHKKIHKMLIRNNEAEANRVIGKLQLAIAGIYILVGILNLFNILANKTPYIYIPFFACGIVMALLPLALWGKKKTWALHWLKYVSFFLISVSILVTNVVTGYRLWLLYALPILLSLRYYDKKLTTITAFYAEVMTVASAFTNAYLSPLTRLFDLNLVSFSEPGTLDYYSYLHNAVLQHGYDPKLLLSNGLRLAVLPNILAIVIITLIATRLIDNALYLMKRESEEHEKELLFLRNATTDSMTGLLNRRAYNEYCAGLSPETMENLVFGMFDVNGLKETNDVSGHAAGDELIRGAAQCIKETFAPYGNVYRWGGDEFVALFYTDDERLKAIKAEFGSRVAAWRGDTVQTLSVSAGYVSAREMTAPFTLSDIEALADKRMYEIKKAHYAEEKYDRRRR